MPVTSLERVNIEASIKEFQEDEAVLGKYRDRGFFTLDEAMNYLSGEINTLEGELMEQEEEST
jgi:hypothetical protein